MIHFHPVPGNIEYVPQHSGIIYNGEFIKAYPGVIKLLQLFLENLGRFVSVYSISKKCELKMISVKVYINRTRPLIHKMGYSLYNDQELGYRMCKMKDKK